MLKTGTKRLVRAGVIAALYVASALLTFPVASGAMQFRISEAFTLLPIIFPETVAGLAAGCVLSNIMTGCALWDTVLGSIITLIAATLTYCTGKFINNIPLKIIVGGFFPVALNAFVLPVVWILCYGGLEYMYILQAVFLLITQSVSVYALGIPIYLSVKRLKDKGFQGFID